MVDFLYGMDWRRFVEEKWMKMLKSNIFWAKSRIGIGLVQLWAKEGLVTSKGFRHIIL